jgi:hypothetical protein
MLYPVYPQILAGDYVLDPHRDKRYDIAFLKKKYNVISLVSQEKMGPNIWALGKIEPD